MDPDVIAAVRASHFRDLPAEVLERLFEGASLRKVPAGRVAHREGEEAPYLELLVSGVIRVFVTAADGRTMTIRYCRPGELLGAMSLFLPDAFESATKQALVDAELLELSPAVVRDAVRRDLKVAHVFLTELSERAHGFVNEIPGQVFASVRQRVARQLLDLAASQSLEAGVAGEFVVEITQQELAASAGTVREVVVRALRRLRETGVVRTERDRIVILDLARLTVEWNGTKVPDERPARVGH